MTPRPTSIHDRETSQGRSEQLGSEEEKATNKEISELKTKRAPIPGNFDVGDLIRARSFPSIQGIVLGKTRGREAVRVLLAPYSTTSGLVPAVVTDIPAPAIPPQSGPLTFTFSYPTSVQNCVAYFASKGAIRKEQELILLNWLNRKEPEESVFSASSDISVIGATSPGKVRARVIECEKACAEVSSSSRSAPNATPASTASPRAAQETGSQSSSLTEGDRSMQITRSEIRTRSADCRDNGSSSRPDPPPTIPAAPAVPLMTGSSSSTQNPEAVSQGQLQEFRDEVRQQMRELQELIMGISRKQQTTEKERRGSQLDQWDELEYRVNAMQRSEERNCTRARQPAPPIDEADVDWTLRAPHKDDTDWQVKPRGWDKGVGDGIEEVLECPFSLQARRMNGYRVQRAHRRAHRRLLEDIYGSHDTAVEAAHDVLDHMEKDVRSPSWEVATFLNIARGLDIMLLEHKSGMWAQWNEPIIDYFARYYFEMLARIRPDEEVAQLMNTELQKKLREFNFGKQRSFGPITWQGRNSKNWRNTTSPYPATDFLKGTGKDSNFANRKSQWGNQDRQTEPSAPAMEASNAQGAWLWHPGPPPGKPPNSFRPDPPPPPPGQLGTRS